MHMKWLRDKLRRFASSWMLGSATCLIAKSISRGCGCSGRFTSGQQPVGNRMFCTDPPYNGRCIENRSNSEYDVLSCTDMEDTAQWMWDVLKKGGLGHILCS